MTGRTKAPAEESAGDNANDGQEGEKVPPQERQATVPSYLKRHCAPVLLTIQIQI